MITPESFQTSLNAFPVGQRDKLLQYLYAAVNTPMSRRPCAEETWASAVFGIDNHTRDELNDVILPECSRRGHIHHLRALAEDAAALISSREFAIQPLLTRCRALCVTSEQKSAFRDQFAFACTHRRMAKDKITAYVTFFQAVFDR